MMSVVRQFSAVLSVGAVCFTFGSRAAAQPLASPSGAAPVRQLLLDDQALARWLQTHSPTVGASQARVAQAQSAARASALLPNPTLDLSVSNITLGQTNPPGLARSDTLLYGAGLTQLVELGKRGPRIDAAGFRVQSAKADHTSVTTETIARARYALGRTVYLRSRQRILEESRDNARRVAVLEKARLENAALSGIDYDRILLDLASLEADIRRTQAEYASALAECSSILVAPCDADPASETDLNRAAELPASPDSLTGLINRRADLLALKFESEASRRDAKLAARRAIPDLSVRVGYAHDNLTIAGDQENTLSVSVSLPLPVFDHGQHDKSRSLSRALELDQTRRALTTNALADLQSLIAKKSALERTLSVLESETLPRSASVLESAQKAFDQGQFSLTDLLIARRSDIALRLSHSDARFELFAVRSELRQVLGLDENPASSKE